MCKFVGCVGGVQFNNNCKCAVAANSEDPFLTSTYGVAYTRGIQEGEDQRFLQAVVTL